MITTVLIIHALMAVALLGVLRHQTLRMWWPAAARTGAFLTEYLLPEQINIRRVLSTIQPHLSRRGSVTIIIVKPEPLD